MKRSLQSIINRSLVSLLPLQARPRPSLNWTDRSINGNVRRQRGAEEVGTLGKSAPASSLSPAVATKTPRVEVTHDLSLLKIRSDGKLEQAQERKSFSWWHAEAAAIEIGHGFQLNQRAGFDQKMRRRGATGRCGGINGECEESHCETLVAMVHTIDLGVPSQNLIHPKRNTMSRARPPPW
jgi:hypothetical protein